jgi:energy-coupling factor transporter ATP-binding protein EcfA2
LISADEGDVLIEGIAVKPGYPEAVRNNRVAYLAQQIEELFYGDTVRQELTYDQQGNLPDQLQVLQDLELEHLVDRNVDSLSGGERQAVALAQFMASQAPLLILDEPSSYLDQHRAALLKHYLSKAHQAGKTIIHITQYNAEIAWGSHSIDLDTDAPEVLEL